MAGSDLEYCMMRARQEAHRALRSNSPEVAAVHQRMSVRYSAKAFLLRTSEADTDPDDARRGQVIIPVLRA